MSEPTFIARGPLTDDRAASWLWLREMSQEARDAGCTFCRASYGDERGLLLFEGWLEQPDDQGEQRWDVPERRPARDRRSA